MGERKFVLKPLAEAAERAVVAAVGLGDEEDMRVSTPGGVFQVRWDDRGGATAMGQLPFFAEYLNATGLFENWVRDCPLSYLSPNAPGLVDVLGTWMLSILDGHNRYAHVGMLRGERPKAGASRKGNPQGGYGANWHYLLWARGPA